MPITLSIIITNPATGEALYSFTKTSYATTRVIKINISGAEAAVQNSPNQSSGGQAQLPASTDRSAPDAEEDREMFVNARPSDQEQAQMIADAGANYQQSGSNSD